MTLEIVFLGAAKVAVDRGEMEPLCRMKIPGDSTSETSLLVAFSSMELGRQYIDSFARPTDFSLLPHTCLNSGQYENRQEQKVLLFVNADQIAEYNMDRQHFNYSAHLVSIDEALAKGKNAL